MEFDLVELENVRAGHTYQQELLRSCEYAKLNKKLGNKPPKIVDDKLIEFYGSERGYNNDKYGKWLSNCVYAPIDVNGEKNKSSEHYYQRQKFVVSKDDPDFIKWCNERRISPEKQIENNNNVRSHMATLSPVDVARYGQTVRSTPMRSDWNNIRDIKMWEALIAKFTQNKDFADALKSTGTRVLIERAPTDAYWAVNSSGNGLNTLGVMLMVIRELLE